MNQKTTLRIPQFSNLKARDLLKLLFNGVFFLIYDFKKHFKPCFIILHFKFVVSFFDVTNKLMIPYLIRLMNDQIGTFCKYIQIFVSYNNCYFQQVIFIWIQTSHFTIDPNQVGIFDSFCSLKSKSVYNQNYFLQFDKLQFYGVIICL